MSEGLDEELLLLFREEAVIQIAALTEALVALEDAADRRPVLDNLMRAAHSLKGAAQIVGLTPLVKLAHTMEDLFVAALAGTLEVTPAAVDVLLGASDFFAELSAGDTASFNQRAPEIPGWITKLADIRAGRLPESAPAADAATPAPAPAPAPAPSQLPAEPTALATPAEPPAPKAILDDAALADLSLLELFREEAETQLAAMTMALVALDDASEPKPHLEALMRAAHSMKGAARIVGIDTLVKLAHTTEDLFVAALAGTVRITPAIVDIVFSVVDFIADLSSGDADKMSVRQAGLPELMSRLTAAKSGAPVEEPSPTPAPVPQSAQGAGSAPATESTPAAGSAPTVPISQIKESAPAGAGAPAPLPQSKTNPAASPPAAAARADTSGRSIRMTAEALERLTGLAAEAVVEAERLEQLLDQNMAIRKAQRALDDGLSALRDTLRPGADAAGQSLLANIFGARDALQKQLAARETALEDYARRSSTVARRLSRESMASRMLPFGSILRGFPRLVRDICRDLGKRCRFEILGEGTQVDREILEQMEAPLNHIVRNALDHGLEMPDVRTSAGKPAEGRLTLEAFHRAGRLMVQIRDDGRGIEVEGLRRRIVERGLETPERAASLSAEELYEFLFLPGFSTAAKVTELSGRGVGLDAVRTMVQGAGGAVTIASTPGVGTMFNIELPVTRSVTRALLAIIGGEPYALPTSNVERVVSIDRNTIVTIEGRPCFTCDGEHVAIVSAAEILELPDVPALGSNLSIVVLAAGRRRYGLAVDSFEGERSLVVRRLDPRLGDVPDVAAVSTDDRGRVILILDLEELVSSIDALISGGRKLGLGTLGGVARRSKRILVVDDSLTVRETERQLLAGRGYDVEVAVDGLEGWSAVRLGQYDLVVSDVDMPRMNGIELVRRIRADATLATLPVIIVSYKDREEDRLRGLEAGATQYLTKGGFKDSALVGAVEDLIGPPNEPPR
jgi:two-component system sensor histidine kinase and response regulator WspE